MLPNVVITETLDTACADWLKGHANVVWAAHDQPELLDPALAEADGLVVRTYTQVNDALLTKALKLRVVGRAGVGIDNIDIAACRRRNVRVVYTPDANTQAVVEYIFALMLDAIRPRESFNAPITAAEFKNMRQTNIGGQLDEMTLGIVGFGRIGKRLGRAAHALGIKLLVNDILPEASLRAAVEYPFEFVDQNTLYRRSDIVTIHVDGRSENRHMIDVSALSLLKNSCLFINAARGMLIDASALAAWARRVQPYGGRAILDVHDPEPPSADYPLYGLPNVRLLPHIASRTETALRNMSWVVRDIAAVLQGRSPQYPAD